MDTKAFADLVMNTRSVRRFDSRRAVAMDELEALVALARISPSAGNLQPLKYVLSCDPETNEAIFACLGWAAYLPAWRGPEEGERPTGYIVILGDAALARKIDCDHGIVAQTMHLGARTMGLGSCMLGSMNKARLGKVLDLAEGLEILLVLALGAPGEDIRLEDVAEPDASDAASGVGPIKYWRGEDGVHHVPKRAMNELIWKRFPETPDT